MSVHLACLCSTDYIMEDFHISNETVTECAHYYQIHSSHSFKPCIDCFSLEIQITNNNYEKNIVLIIHTKTHKSKTFN